MDETSLKVGIIAGIVATTIGLILFAGGISGEMVDNIIMFITNLFTVISSFVLLILISDKCGPGRGGALVAVIIGITSWTWTTRSVRSQVISLKQRSCEFVKIIRP